MQHALRNNTGKIPYGDTVHFSCDVGHTIEDGMLDAPTLWTVSCDADGAFGAGHTANPVKFTAPSVANTEHPENDLFIFFGKTVTLRVCALGGAVTDLCQELCF